MNPARFLRCSLTALTVFLVLFAIRSFATNPTFGPYQVVRTLPNPPHTTGGLAFFNGYLYSVEDTFARIYQIDPVTGQILANWTATGFSPPSELPAGLASDGTGLWLLTRGQVNSLYHISLGPSTNVTKLSRYSLAGQEEDLAYVNGFFMSPELNGPIRTIDPANGAFVGSIPSPYDATYGLTFDGSTLLAGNGLNGTIWQISPQDGTVLDTWQSGVAQCRGLAYDLSSQTLFIATAGSGIVVAQIPEPKLSGIVALAAVILIAKRRKGSRTPAATPA